MKKKRLTNYSAKIASINRAMLDEIWDIIEKRAETDDRYEADKRYASRTFDNDEKEFCEVSICGRDYGVSGIRMEEHWKWGKSVNIISDGYQYSGLDTDNLCILLSALRRQRQRKAEWKRKQQRMEEVRRLFKTA